MVGARSGLREDLLGITRAELERELELATREFEDAPGGASPDSLARALTERIGHRVTVVDTGGVVLGDSDLTADRIAALESLADRPEIQGALDDGVSYAERVSATVDRRLLYGARRIELDGRPVVLRLAASLDEVDATLRDFLATVAGAGAAATLVALIIAYLLSRRLARPLALLAGRARSLAEGDLEVRAPRSTRVQELDELGTAFNRLAEELRDRLGELGRERDQMRTLVDSMAEGVLALTDDARVLRANAAARELLELPEPLRYAPVGSLVRQPELRDLLESAVLRPFQSREISIGERQLIVQSRLLEGGGAVITFLDVSELRRMERVRRDFVANASHELKTPLTSMRGFAETLLDDDPPDEVRRRFLRTIRDNTLRLQRLVEDLLDLSRLESGAWSARSEPVAVAPLAREVLGDLSERADEKNLEMAVRGDAEARADRRGLTQVLRNLVENSIQYTPAGGSVTVEVQARNGRVAVEVRDSGIGIPSSDLNRIFERFYRVDPARSRDAGGTGLGLAIVKHLVEVMDGSIEAESRLGRGTTVRVLLPASE